MRIDRTAAHTASAACLALPLALLHARAAAEVLIAAIDILFLLHVWISRDLAWLRRPFAWAAFAWWAWLALCSALGTGGLVLGILAIRLPLLSIAAGDWLLQAEPVRRQHRLWLVLAAAFAWVGIECWQQALTGSNLFGQPRWIDGALTGPFNKPRAGPAFILLFFPVLVPAAMGKLNDPLRWRRAGGLVLAALGVVTMVLIGQRMPGVLMVLGLGVTAMLLPRLRLAVLAAGVLGAITLAALPVLSPATNAKLVLRFADQMRHFTESDYGIIFVRAVGVAQLHPWIGLGFDGFRRGCSDIWAMHGIAWLNIPTYQLNGGMRACNLHPHNYYLEAADNAGWPGAALFALMVLTALARLGRGLWRAPAPGRVGLFVGALVALWPVASTSALTSMPNAGWVFLVLGFGFAAGTRDAAPRLDRAAGGIPAT